MKTIDNELTLCAKQLGYRVLSPSECTVVTAIMPDFRSLFKQRRRWQRGALENLYAHKIDRYTAPYILRQWLTYAGVLFVALYLTTLSVALYRDQNLPWNQPIWLIVFATYVIEQVIAVHKGGWKAVVTTLLIVPEVFYNMFLNYVYIVSLEGLIFDRSESWGRVRDVKKGGGESDKKTRTDGQAIDRRLTVAGRVIAVGIELVKDATCVAILSLAFWNESLAWVAIGTYVLIGFGATVFRLVPRKTF